MRNRALLRFCAALASGVAMLAATHTHAQNFRSYLSLNGNDANACTLPAPCRLLPAALATVNNGGEIWMLDSANFNTATVAINKSVTILAIPGAMGSIVANGSDAISINASGVKVALRNLVLLNLSGAANRGVSFLQGANLTIEGTQVYGLATGVFASASGAMVTIKDSTLRDNDTGISLAGGIRAQLLNVALLNNLSTGMAASNGARVAISGGAVSGGGVGVAASAASSTITQVAVTATAVSGNVTGLQAIAATGADQAQVMLNNVMLTQNSTGVAISGATATVFSRQNNAFKFNILDVSPGALSPLAAQ